MVAIRHAGHGAVASKQNAQEIVESIRLTGAVLERCFHVSCHGCGVDVVNVFVFILVVLELGLGWRLTLGLVMVGSGHRATGGVVGVSIVNNALVLPVVPLLTRGRLEAGLSVEEGFLAWSTWRLSLGLWRRLGPLVCCGSLSKLAVISAIPGHEDLIP